MGWTFPWVSSAANSFSRDFGVAFTPDDFAPVRRATNYGTHRFTIEDVPAISVFFRTDGGQVFHTYSSYSRGLDMMNGAYHYLDIMPKGRDEEGLPSTMNWLRLRDEYGR